MAELTIIVPTLNEVENLSPFIARLDAVMAGIDWELIFVDDDSRDGTADRARGISAAQPRVRVIQRIGRSGLASACIEGMLATAAPVLAVMDADMQHDESVLPVMYRLLRSEDLDIVVGSRHVGSGSMGQMPARRKALSRLGARISAAVCHCDLSDPMSGYFVLTRQFLNSVIRRLSGIGFKILTDILASSPRPVRLREVGYTFRNRVHGASKLDMNTCVEYFLLVSDKILGGVVPARYIGFALVGLVGLVLHLTVVAIGYRYIGVSFFAAQTCATFVGMVSNFLLNNATTYYDIRLHGWSMLKGFVAYCIACSLGALANIGIAQFLADRQVSWYLASSLGLMISSVWNYSATAIFTWRILRGRRS